MELPSLKTLTFSEDARDCRHDTAVRPERCVRRATRRIWGELQRAVPHGGGVWIDIGGAANASGRQDLVIREHANASGDGRNLDISEQGIAAYAEPRHQLSFRTAEDRAALVDLVRLPGDRSSGQRSTSGIRDAGTVDDVEVQRSEYRGRC
jgi:hypothetical protein